MSATTSIDDEKSEELITPLDDDDMKVNLISVEINNETHQYKASDLTTLQYFDAKLSQRWASNSNKNTTNSNTAVIKIGSDSEKLPFTHQELSGLVYIRTNSEIPVNFSFLRLESLLWCDDFFAEKLMTATMIIKYLNNSVPFIDKKSRNYLLNETKHEILKQCIIKFENSLTESLNQARQQWVGSYNTKISNSITLDAVTAMEIFVKRFIITNREMFSEYLQTWQRYFQLSKFENGELEQLWYAMSQHKQPKQLLKSQKLLHCLYTACQSINNASKQYQFQTVEECNAIQHVLVGFLRLAYDNNNQEKKKNDGNSSGSSNNNVTGLQTDLILRASLDVVIDRAPKQDKQQKFSQVYGPLVNKMAPNDLRILLNSATDKLTYLKEYYDFIFFIVQTRIDDVGINLCDLWFPRLFNVQSQWILNVFVPKLSTKQIHQFAQSIATFIVSRNNADDIDNEYFKILENALGVKWKKIEKK